MHKQGIKKNSANVEALYQGYLIITKSRFPLTSADAVKISYYPERLENRPQTPNNRSLF